MPKSCPHPSCAWLAFFGMPSRSAFVAQCEMRVGTSRMTPSRHRNAWIWVAIAAMAVASLARAQAGIQTATAYANPVLEFLAGHPSAAVLATNGAPRLFEHRSARQARAALSHGADSGPWTAMLPVFFVGLIAPMSLISPRSVVCLGRTHSAPALPSRFQRPPPSLLI